MQFRESILQDLQLISAGKRALNDRLEEERRKAARCKAKKSALLRAREFAAMAKPTWVDSGPVTLQDQLIDSSPSIRWTQGLPCPLKGSSSDWRLSLAPRPIFSRPELLDWQSKPHHKGSFKAAWIPPRSGLLLFNRLEY